MPTGKYAYLIMVTPDNHNKYYRMTQQDGMFLAEYGRIGAEPQRITYPMSRWDLIYSQKLKKGYRDQTDLHTAPVVRKSSDYKEIEDKAVRWLVDTLLLAAQKTVSSNYRANPDEVTNAMIQEAKLCLLKLNSKLSVSEFNDILLQLFSAIPRRMKSVDTYLAKSEKDYGWIVSREQSVLDAMAGQVYTRGVATAQEKGDTDKTILESIGVTIRPCTDKENQQIKEHMTAESSGHFKQAFRVENKKVSERMEQYMRDNDIKHPSYLYHGSATRNFWNIIAMGLDVNPNASITGKMFGNGSYFANRARKSLRYTDLSGMNNVRHCSGSEAFLAVFKVAYKHPLDIQRWTSECSNYDCQNLRAKGGYDAVFAHKGVDLLNDEIIVYQNCQSAPQYLIELK